MALTQTNSTMDPRSFSIGPVKQQIINFTIVSGDTSATITADNLSSLEQIHIHGMALTAAPTYSGNTVTVAFVDPAATRYGSVLCMGR